MKKILELKGVNKTIGKKEIVKDLTFAIEEGEIFGFLGPNGAGKTTTIKMITGLISITSGEIFIDGISIKEDFEKALKNVGGIIENPEMYGYLTGLDNLKIYARMQNCLDKEKINKVVSLVKLENRINDKVKGYSLGMRQRLGLAQALLHEPKLIILDEPTNGLDPVGIKELRETLKELTKKGVSVLVSSHLLSEMELMCDRFCIIDSGVLKGIKTMNDIKESKDESIKTYLMETSDNENSMKIIEKFENVEINKNEEKIIVKTSKENIAKINKALVLKDIDVFEISIHSKTLEEEFVEITGSKQLR